ncbi:MAG: DMT family transporter [Beijerinckiaceae bacterium]
MKQPINTTMSASQWGELFLLSLLWGATYLYVAVALREVDPFTIALCRVGFAAVFLFGVLAVMRLAVPATARAWAAFAGMGTLNNVIPFMAIFWGQKEVASGLTSILIATTPLFTALFAHFMTDDEKLSVNKLAGIGIGFLGVVVLLGPVAGAGGAGIVSHLAIIAGAMSYGLGGIFGRRFAPRGYPPLVLTTGQLTMSTLILGAISFAFGNPLALASASLTTWGVLLAISIPATALAYLLYFRVLTKAGATNIMLVTLLMPVTAILLGAIVLDERLAWTHFACMALIAAGLAAIDGRLLRRMRAAT